MRFLCLLFSVICLGPSCFAQSSAGLASQRHGLQDSPKDTARISGFIAYLSSSGGQLPKDTLLSGWNTVYELSSRARYDKGIGLACTWFGNYYNASGNYTQSLKYLFEAEKVFKRLNDYKKLAGTYNLIGNTYMGLNNMQGQKEYFTRCYDLAVEHSLSMQKAYGAGGLGNYYASQKDYAEAIRWNLISAGLFRENKNYIGCSIIHTNTAALYRQLGNRAKAEELVDTAEAYLPLAKLSYAAFVCYQEKGMQADLKGNYPEALRYYRLALDLMLDDKANHNISETYKRLSEVAYKARLFKESADYLSLHVQYKDSVFNETSSRQLLDVQAKYETEKKDAEIEILNKQNALAQSELDRKKVLIYSVIAVAALLLGLVVFAIQANLRKNRTNALLERQKVIIEEKQKEIVDSINYARRIQDALLAGEDIMKACLPGHFILFEPKDIVSGDFYWLSRKDGFIYLAVCDCTGHGVPGAFMSLLSSNFLAEAINEKHLSEPGQVLDYVRERLISKLGGGNDGMDAILIRLPETALEQGKAVIRYASANNRLVIVRGGIPEELPTDKMPVGKGEKQGSFSSRSLEVAAGDMLYLYTDGYADQFGGEKGKKFKHKNLNGLLASISGLPPEAQEQRLRQAFTAWRGALEQVDDVCIVGIRL